PEPPLGPPLRAGPARQPPGRRGGPALAAGGHVSAPLRQRAEAMANRLETAALRAGLGDDGAATILDAYRTAMRPRERSLADDHHVDYLHPARTTLILLEDLGITEPTILAAGALTE